jgi:DNA-binding MurR/RpiR family transcriptional regulator
MPDGSTTAMDSGAVSRIAQEFGHLSEALVKAAGYATASPLTVAEFGSVDIAQRVGADFLAVTGSLARSLGYVGALTQAAEKALLDSAGLTDLTEQQNARNLTRAGGC